MSTPEERLSKLRRFNSWVRRGDGELAEESADLRGRVESELESEPAAVEHAVELESIVLRRERPVLTIHENETQLVFIDQADSQIWQERLKQAKPLLDQAIRAVGRIELKGGRLDWVGTGWLVSENVIVTNRHVAVEFAMRRGEGFTFRAGTDGAMRAAVDFIQEVDNPATLVFKLLRPIHIEEAPGPDLAFFEIELTSGGASLASPIKLADKPAVNENIATIGYPAYDSRIPEPELMERIFGKTYNKKRLAPGAVTAIEKSRILHNCTTLGGNSGSVLFDLVTGEAVGLHFSGSFLATNYAVRSDVVKAILANPRSGRRPQPDARSGPRKSALAQPSRPGRQGGAGTASVTIPLTVTVSVSVDGGRMPRQMQYAVLPPRPTDSEGDASYEEARAEDYLDREGYLPGFLGDGFEVDLPSVERDREDVLPITEEGRTGIELRYEHYSVVMSHSRRMCFLSAVNIDGGLSKKSKRVGWKWDPRISKERQIMAECYGDPPRFSRGHMTRREDPGWGGDAETATRGNQDSMHVTNATPQMQAFNSPIWLALEDYALGHAREDAMKISVFTGPYFSDEDPVMYGVQIPLAFWKIIAFIHDETGELCATGYEMTQDQSLQPEEEFVFGAFQSTHLQIATQVPISAIEARSGISFGNLASVDPLAGVNEAAGGGGAAQPLYSLEQIRFS